MKSSGRAKDIGQPIFSIQARALVCVYPQVEAQVDVKVLAEDTSIRGAQLLDPHDALRYIKYYRR